MLRRVHVEAVRVGLVRLAAAEGHHLRDVLRLPVGASVEVFDDAGVIGVGHLEGTGDALSVRIETAGGRPPPGLSITVAAAVPKGDRADWMVEKLSEVGVGRFVPVSAARSVVLPTGKSKRERWERIAAESAKQCRRAGVMVVGPLTPVAEVVAATSHGWFLSTATDAVPAAGAALPVAGEVTLFVGPEGGWTDDEVAAFRAAGVVGVGLTATVLRVETAAVVAAAWVATRARGRLVAPDGPC